MQTETDRRTDVMLGRLVQHVHDASEQTNRGGATTVASHVTLEESLQNTMREYIARVQAQFTELLNAPMGKMQAESVVRAEAMLEHSEQKPYEASDRTDKSAASAATTREIPEAGVNQKLHSQLAQEAQRKWAELG
jgi:hypothetical protein